jgi:hypothetical protein
VGAAVRACIVLEKGIRTASCDEEGLGADDDDTTSPMTIARLAGCERSKKPNHYTSHPLPSLPNARSR